MDFYLAFQINNNTIEFGGVFFFLTIYIQYSINNNTDDSLIAHQNICQYDNYIIIILILDSSYFSG